jgi:hypothetical protein
MQAMSQQGVLSFNELMQAGRKAFTAGKRKTAHDLWREAANINPYDEQVWLALLDVLEGDSDRRVCLQNILSINPLNVQARRALGRLEASMRRRQEHQQEMAQKKVIWQQHRRRLLINAVMLGVAVGLSGVMFGILASIIWYSGLV